MLLPALLLAASIATNDTTAKAPLPPPKTIAELEARIKQVLDSTHTPGVGLAIVRHDSVIYTGGIGLARVSPKLAATDSTLFRIGSTSKTFVALTALALQQEGKLSLQDDLRQRLPGLYFRNAWQGTDPVRIANLLEHTSGFDDNSLKSYANNDPTPLALAEGLRLDSTTRVSRWRPSTRFSYCNTGPPIVARIAEEIEKKPFEQIVQERWFTPIGMTTATYLRPDSLKLQVATLYHDDGVTPVPYWYVFLRPAGSIHASAHDMAAYVRFLLGRGTIDGKALLPKEAIERMERSETSLMSRAGLTVGYGLNMYRVADTTGWTWTEHNGGVEGGLSDLSYLPDQGIGYAFQINSGSGKALWAIQGLVRAFLTQGLTPPAKTPRTPLAAGMAAQFGGWYRPVSPRMEHLQFEERILNVEHVTFGDSSVEVKPLFGDASTLIPVGPRLFRRANEPVATLVFVNDSANGRPQGMESFGARLGGSSARVSTLSALGTLALTCCWLAAVLWSVIVALFSAIRWIVRRMRMRTAAPSAATVPWRFAIAAGIAITVNLLVLVASANDVRVVGNATPPSIIVWVAGILFAIVSIAGGLVAYRRRATSTRWERVSLAAARIVITLDLVAAIYLTYWRYIGWRTWG